MIPQTLRKPRLQLFLFLFILTATLLWQTRSTLTPFILSLTLAYLLLPLVNRVQRYLPQAVSQRSMARPLAIMLVYLLVLLLIVGSISTVVPPIIGQFATLYANGDELFEQAVGLVNEGLKEYEQQIPPDVQIQIEEELQKQLRNVNAASILDPLFSGVMQAAGAISNTVSFMLGLLVVPFWMFFILNDESAAINGVMGIIPHDLRPDVEAVRIMMNRILSAYIRGQLIVASALGILIFIGLFLLNVRYSMVLGLTAGLLGIIPYLGAILGALPAIFVAFLQSPQLALWVVVLFVVVQQIDNVFISPKITGEAVALHPAIIMVVIVLGTSLLGILGAVMAVPLTAILRDIAHYFYIRADEEPVSPVEAIEMVGYGDSVTPLMRGHPLG